MKKTRKLLSIDDLYSFKGDVVTELEKVWNPAQEIDDWIGKAREIGMQWQIKHTFNDHRLEGYFHPSSFSNTCDNFLYLELLEAERKNKNLGKRTKIYDIGTAYHLVLNYWTPTRAIYHNYTHLNEFPVKDFDYAKKLRMCGSADGYEERTIGDIELKFFYEFKSTKSAAKLGNRPSTSYRQQISGYMRAADVPITVFIYVDKSTEDLVYFIERYQDPTWRPIEKRLKSLIELAKDKNMYQHADKNINKSCRFCDFFEVCKPDMSKFNKGVNKWRTPKKRKMIVQ